MLGVAAGVFLPFAAPLAPVLTGLGGASISPLWAMWSERPPKPYQAVFAPISLLFDLASHEKKPVSMPLWRKLMNAAAVLAITAGLAYPDYEPGNLFTGEQNGPVIIQWDNGFISAENEQTRLDRIRRIIDRADRDGRDIIFAATASRNKNDEPLITEAMNAAKARSVLLDVQSEPWPVDRAAYIEAIDNLNLDGTAEIHWLSNGVDYGYAAPFMEALQKQGRVTVYSDTPETAPHPLSLKENPDNELIVTIHRLHAGAEEETTITATDVEGRTVKQMTATFAADELTADVIFDLPPELRRTLSKISVDGEENAGSVLLLDENWRQRRVGLLQANIQEDFDGMDFVRDAIIAFTDLREGSFNKIMAEDDLAVIIMTDETTLSPDQEERLKEWVENGGTFLRFAGPNLATRPDASLLPVKLRRGQRFTDSTLTGGSEERDFGGIVPFEKGTPFHGIDVPEDISVQTLVMPDESGVTLADKTWARLEDGSPLVTAKQEGKGWTILVHTTANMDWANFPLSGEFFLKMLRAKVNHSVGGVSSLDQLSRPMEPVSVLDARGRLRTAPNSVEPLSQSVLDAQKMGPKHPPGYYGERTNADGEGVKVALNISSFVNEFKPLAEFPEGITTKPYEKTDTQFDLMTWLIIAGLVGFAADTVIRAESNGQAPRAPSKSDNKRSLFGRRKTEPSPE